jgi:hypothetical protein
LNKFSLLCEDSLHLNKIELIGWSMRLLSSHEKKRIRSATAMTQFTVPSRLPFFASSCVALCFVCYVCDSIDINRFTLFLISNIFLYFYSNVYCIQFDLLKGRLKKMMTSFKEIIREWVSLNF